MIVLKGLAAVYGDLWFDEEPPRHPGVDIFRYYCRQSRIPNARCVPFLSMVTDLSAGTDPAADFTRDCRYKIRRADSKDGLKLEWITDCATRLDEFQTFFNAFARQKGHEPCDEPWLHAANKAGQLTLAAAVRDGEPLVWHAYLTAAKVSWLHYSGSCFRDKENDYRSLVGRANRWLHWRALMQFQEAGMMRYDWGGMFEDESAPERAGINGFKRSFGGRLERTYNCTLPVTFRGQVYVPLRNAWNNRKAMLWAKNAGAQHA